MTSVAQDFIYPTNADGGATLRDPVSGQDVPVEWERILRDVKKHSGYAHQDWYLSSSFRKMKPGDQVWFYAAGDMVLFALAEAQRIYQRGGQWRLALKWDLRETARLGRSPIRCTQGPQSPQGLNADSTRAIRAWQATAMPAPRKRTSL